MKRAWLEWAHRTEQGAPKIDATVIVTRFGFRPTIGAPSFGDQRFDFREPGPLQSSQLSVNRETGQWVLTRSGLRLGGGRDLGNFGDEIRRIEQGG